MDSLYLLLGLPSLVSLFAAAFPGLVKSRSQLVGGGIAALFFGGAILLLISIANGTTSAVTAPWLPALGIHFSLTLTAFTSWFGVLILFLGACVHFYACVYFKNSPRLPSLLILLGLFTTAMLGVIWSDNLYLLFLFWEGTSLLSFLLVGFHNDLEKSRKNATQALLITMAGGVSLLVAFILLHHHTGTAAISEILLSDPTTISTAAVIFLILGAMTKSAQWPFHFWLPNAMVGPTPVSAYLHSATMVKAGVFLLGVFAPLLHTHHIWTPLLGFVGVMTVATAVLRGSREQDLKAVLACTTLAALGFLTVLAGVGTPAAMLGFVIFLTAHALYKAPLFLSAGNLEKRFGTRDLRELRGAARSLKVTGTVVVISALSLIGLAPLPGFLGKEYLLKATWAYSPFLAIAVAIAAAGVLALGFRIILPLLSKSETPKISKELPTGMSAAALLPALAALLVVFSLPMTSHEFLGPAAAAAGADPEASYKLWHGFTPALGLGTGALLLSLLIAWVMNRPGLPPLPEAFKPIFDRLFDTLISALKATAAEVAKLLEKGSIPTHLTVMLVGIGALSFISLDLQDWDKLPLTWTGHSMIFLGLLPLLVISIIVATRTQKTLPLLVSLGFVGFLVALIFLWFSSPDLALTQLMAETLVLFLLAGALAKTKGQASSEPGFFRLIFSILAGLLVTLLILKSMILEFDHPVSDYFLRESKTAAYGANVVNVILVDFRALDTLGEIIVLAIAAMGANSALGAARKRAPLPPADTSSLLRAGSRVVAIFLVPTIIWIFWRGHNAPGGGFIAALVAAAGVGMGILSSWRHLTASFLRRTSHRLLIIGMSIAILSALIPLTIGETFFKGLWIHFDDLHLGTPLIFDLGVFLTVLGFCLNYLRHFHLRQS